MRNAGLRTDQAPPLDIPLRFFLTAPLFEIAAGVLLLFHGSAALTVPLLPLTVALTHLLVLGWVTQVMLGALYQIVPVLLGVPVPWVRLGRWVHGALTLGTALLAAGLAWRLPPALIVAGVLLVLGLGLQIVQVGIALTWCAARTASFVAVAAAISALAVTVGLGAVFALEHATGQYLTSRSSWVAIHAIWGLAGWVGLLLAVVGFGVLPMFHVAPPFPRALTGCVLAGLAASLAFSPAALAPGSAWPLSVLGAAVAWAAFLLVLGRLWKTRSRKASDPTFSMWLAGWLFMGLALGLLGAFALTGQARWLLAAGCAYVVGGVISVELAMLCKIVPFLVWLHRFSPHVGKVRVPMVADILPPRRVARQALLHGCAAVLLTSAAIVSWDGLARLAGFALMISAGDVAWMLWRAARYPAVSGSAAVLSAVRPS